MSFMVYPQPDACRALMPEADPAPPGPPSWPMVCHMPAGHDGQHSNERRPGLLSRRWDGDARPARPVAPSEPPTAAQEGGRFDRLLDAEYQQALRKEDERLGLTTPPADAPEQQDDDPDWTFDAENGWLYGPDPDHPRLRYPVLTGVDPALGVQIAAAMNLASRRPAETAQQRPEQECSATCDRRICEWCPGHDRHEGAAQWLYKAVIARQERIPTDDVTPWSGLTKDQRNGWRSWADELLSLLSTPAGPADQDGAS